MVSFYYVSHYATVEDYSDFIASCFFKTNFNLIEVATIKYWILAATIVIIFDSTTGFATTIILIKLVIEPIIAIFTYFTTNFITAAKVIITFNLQPILIVGSSFEPQIINYSIFTADLYWLVKLVIIEITICFDIRTKGW